MKIVINECYGGFGLSEKANEILGLDSLSPYYNIGRTDLRLVNLIEEKGSEFVSGAYANLQVVNIPENATDYRITEYDGYESVICVIDGKIVDLD